MTDSPLGRVKRVILQFRDTPPGQTIAAVTGEDGGVVRLSYGDLIEVAKTALDGFTRANEAAMLSAAARDENDDLRKQISDLNEQIEIVESDRTATDIWALNVIAEHGIEHETGDLLDAIAKYIRIRNEEMAVYRHFVANATEAREVYAQDAERLAEQLGNEREAHTKERDESIREIERLRCDLSLARVELQATQDDRDEYRHGVRTYASYASRYKLAWQSARQRAGNHLAALIDADEERDALRAELTERAS